MKRCAVSFLGIFLAGEDAKKGLFSEGNEGRKTLRVLRVVLIHFLVQARVYIGGRFFVVVGPGRRTLSSCFHVLGIAACVIWIFISARQRREAMEDFSCSRLFWQRDFKPF